MVDTCEAVDVPTSQEVSAVIPVAQMSKNQLKKWARRLKEPKTKIAGMTTDAIHNEYLRRKTVEKNETRNRLQKEVEGRWRDKFIQEERDEENRKKAELWQRINDPLVRKCLNCKKFPMDDAKFQKHVLCPRCERPMMLYVGARQHFMKVGDMLRKIYPEQYAYYQYATTQEILTRLNEEAWQSIDFDKKFRELWPLKREQSDEDGVVEVPAY